MRLEDLEREILIHLEKARTQDPMFLILSNFSPDVRTLVEDFWMAGFRNGVIALQLDLLKRDVEDSGMRH